MAKEPKRRNSFARWWSLYVWPFARHLMIPLVCVLVLFAGMAAGYVYLGGGTLSDIWKWDTWKHLYDLIFEDA